MKKLFLLLFLSSFITSFFAQEVIAEIGEGPWDGGYNGKVTITPEENITDWYVILEVEGQVQNTWGGLHTQKGSLVTITSLSYTVPLLAGETITVGFTANFDGIASENAVKLSSYSFSESISNNSGTGGIKLPFFVEENNIVSLNNDYVQLEVPDLEVEDRLTVNGDVIFGDPNETVEGYRLSVDGKIIARGMKIQATGWADYVFEENYVLRPLSEVENYVESNKHLPGVPSQKKVLEEGIDTEEMLKIQMQKIEELTLYLIEVNKQNESLQKRVEKLERTK